MHLFHSHLSFSSPSINMLHECLREVGIMPNGKTLWSHVAASKCKFIWKANNMLKWLPKAEITKWILIPIYKLNKFNKNQPNHPKWFPQKYHITNWVNILFQNQPDSMMKVSLVKAFERISMEEEWLFSKMFGSNPAWEPDRWLCNHKPLGIYFFNSGIDE